MRTRNRVLVIIAVIALSLWVIYPLGNSLKLGLDLNGGVQLVLRVETDDALLRQTQAAAERLRTRLIGDGLPLPTIELLSATEFRVAGVEDQAALRRAADESASIYQQTSAGGTYTFRLPPEAATTLRDQTVEQALRTIE